MTVCRRNGKCIARLAGFISDRDYYASYVAPLPADYTGNGAMLRADEDRKRFLEGCKTARESKQIGFKR